MTDNWQPDADAAVAAFTNSPGYRAATTDYRDYHALFNTAVLHMESVAAEADRKAALAGELDFTRGYRTAATELAELAHLCVTLSKGTRP